MRFIWHTAREKRARFEVWHSWFAWHPVRIGMHQGRWLEMIERKGTHHRHDLIGGAWWTWEYKPREALLPAPGTAVPKPDPCPVTNDDRGYGGCLWPHCNLPNGNCCYEPDGPA